MRYGQSAVVRRLGLAATFLLAVTVTSVSAAPITFNIGVNTSGIAGVAGYIDLQFNPGTAAAKLAVATIGSFVQTGGALAATSTNTGAVAGTLPSTVSLANSSGFNDLFQGDTFGSLFTFAVTIAGAAIDSPGGTVGSTFALSLYGANQVTPLLTGNPDGFLLELFVNPNGSITVSNLNPSVVSVSQVAQPVPEPAALWLSAAASGAAIVRRRRRATERPAV